MIKLEGCYVHRTHISAIVPSIHLPKLFSLNIFLIDVSGVSELSFFKYNLSNFLAN